MKRYIIIFPFLLLFVSLPQAVYSVKKDTKVLLNELQNIGEIIKNLEQKVNAVSVETAAMSKKITIIESKVAALSNSNADTSQNKESLLLSLQFIKEELNELKNSIGKMNDKLVNMPSAVSAEGGVAAPATPAETVTQSPESIYYTAYSDYIKKNYDLAVQGFQQFITHFPQNVYADNSLYWIGECYYAQKKFQEAADTFKQLRTGYPDGDKVLAAMLKEGYALIELGKQTEGVNVLKQLVSKYALSEEASLAQQKIREVMD